MAQATLISYYPFNGNAQDASGNQHHGVVNGCELTCDRFGNEKSAYFFDGESYISIEDHQDFLFSSHDSMSVAAWVKFSIDQPNFAGIVVKGPTNTNRPGFQLVILSQNLPTAEVTIPSNSFVRFVSSDSLSKCVWHFLVATVSTKRSEITLYVDGVVVGSAIYPNIDISYGNNYPIYIGKERNSSVFFTGIIDDVGIYRGILTQNQIHSLYSEKSWPQSSRNCYQKAVDTIYKECATSVILQSHRLKKPYIWSTGATTESLDVNSAGKYWVTGIADDGCSSRSGTDSFIVINKPTTNVSTISDRRICIGDTVNLYATPLSFDDTITYQWYAIPKQLISTTASITVQPNTTTTYYVEATSKIGCVGTDSVTITVNPQQSLNTYIGSVENIYPGAQISIPISFINSTIAQPINKMKCVIRFKGNSCVIEAILTKGTAFSEWEIINKEAHHDSITFELQSLGTGLKIDSFDLALILNMKMYIGDALTCPISAEFYSLDDSPCMSYSFNTGFIGIDTSICGLRSRLIEALQENNMIEIKDNVVKSQITIMYSHTFDEFVDIRIIDMSGNRVKSLVSEEQKSGSYEKTYSISGLSSGLYYCLMQTHNKITKLPFIISH